MNLESLKWWKWALWTKLAGQLLIIYGVWIFASTLKTSARATRSELLPWLGTGLALYLAGRFLQYAAQARRKRIAALVSCR